MSTDRFTLFQETLQTSHAWIRDIVETLGSDDEQQAHHFLCATLRALRDRLRPDDAIQLAAQLPVLIRGLYYEGWRLADVPTRHRTRVEFLADVAARYHARPVDDVEPGVRAVLLVMSKSLDFGATASLLHIVPEDLRKLWPPHMIAAAQAGARPRGDVDPRRGSELAPMVMFLDRRHAGRALAAALASREADGADAVVLALPRGGVPVALEVAMRLGAPLDVFVVRKLGAPGREELAMGAIASGGIQVTSGDVIAQLGIPRAAVDEAVARETREVARRERAYRGIRPPHDVAGRTVILVDDGMATGSTMRAALLALRALGPRRIIVAVPVASRAACDAVAPDADEVVCVGTPDPFDGIGMWYDDFRELADEELRALLATPTVPRASELLAGGQR